jgi:hypothetical protein
VWVDLGVEVLKLFWGDWEVLGVFIGICGYSLEIGGLGLVRGGVWDNLMLFVGCSGILLDGVELWVVGLVFLGEFFIGIWEWLVYKGLILCEMESN